MNTIAKVLIAAALLMSGCKNSDPNQDQNTNPQDNNAVSGPGAAQEVAAPQNPSDTLLPKKKVIKIGKTVQTVIQKTEGGVITVTETEKPYYISGACTDCVGGTVILDELHMGPPKPMYSQTVNPDGLYDFSGDLSEPMILQLRMPAGAIHLVVYPGDTITVTSKLAHPENFTVNGSPETERLRQMYLILEDANKKKDEITNALELEQDKSKLGAMYAAEPAKMQRIDDQKRLNLEKYIDKIDTSFVAVLAALYLDPVSNFDYIEKVVKKFEYKWPNSEYYNSLYKKYITYLPMQIGHNAPEILSSTPEGKEIRLSDFKGKYVLLDFWASWCGPCVKQFPDLTKLYNQYKDKGFVILSVSADDKKDAWLKGIKDNNLPWPQASDVMGFKSGNLQTYLVGNLPDNYLIGPDGKIVAKHMDLPTLRSELAKRIR
jgi:peroxiredoxin